MKLYRGKITLYVKSVKTAVANEQLDIRFPSGALATDDLVMKTRYEYILPWEQQTVVEMVQEVARTHSFQLQIVDVARENILHRIVDKEVKRMRIFPILATDFGARLKGDISRKELESLLLNEERRLEKDYRL